MKITYLLSLGDETGATELATYTQANHLAEHHEVNVISVFRTRPEPFFPEARALPVRYLVDRTASPERPMRTSALDDASCRTLAGLPSELIDPAWESTFDRLSDVELAAALPALDTDVLVTTSPALMVAAVTLAPARVVTVHQEHRPSQRRGRTGEPLQLHGPKLDALVTLTERTRTWLADSLGPSAPELAVIPNAVPDGFRPSADGGSKVIVMAARLTGEKRVDHAILAFGKIADAHPDWTLRVFGGGPLEQELRRLVDGLGLQDRVELLGPCQDMAAEWAKAGLTLLTSGPCEAFPLVLLEALAAGVPAVSYDVVTGPAEIVRHQVDGLLVPPGDIDELAAAMSSLMGDPETRRAYGHAARAGVYERFSSAGVTRLWENLCARLIERRHSREQDHPGGRDHLGERADRVAAGLAAGGGTFRTTAPCLRSAEPGDEERTRESDILAADTSGRLIRSVGRIAEQRDDLTAPAAVDRNLRFTAAALEAHEVPYALVRTAATSHALAVTVEYRERALKALAEAARGRAVYAELVKPRDAAPGSVLAERLDTIGEVAGVKLFLPVTTSTLSLRYGAAQACPVAFWEPTEPEAETAAESAPEAAERASEGVAGASEPPAWRAPFGSTLAGQELPSLTPTATLRVADRTYPTLDIFTRRHVRDVDFPVDAVYTWVDESEESAHDDAVRFRNRDELRFSLRSLTQYAPWIRHIHLVTAGQVPDWLDQSHPGLTVIDHRDLFEHPAASPPTFDSHAIETRLHRVEGLSEHFLYFNDDVFLGRPTTPDTFFLSSGIARFFWSPETVPPLPVAPEDEGHMAAAKHNRALLERDFDRTTTHCLLHEPHALHRSVLAELTDRYSEELAETARSRFRSHRDRALVASLYAHYAYLTGRAVPGSLSYASVDIGSRTGHARLGQLLQSRNKTTFRIGESPRAELSEQEMALAMRAFLTAYFPVASPYERTS